MTLPKLSDIKNWSPEIEKHITSEWSKSEQFKFNPKSKKPTYSIDTPPPYVNSPIHMGHAVTYTYMDFFARYKRMKGFQVLFPLGLDRNGLPIETAAEKKFEVSPFHIGREKFLELCEKLLSEASEESTKTFSRLGISFSSYKKGKNIGDIYHTDSPEYRSLTQSTFISLYKKGLIYEDTRINNWDTKLQTTIADSEIDYKNSETTLNYVNWTLKDSNKKITIATTRPELMSACAMIIFNPTDERYKNLEGKTAIIPLYDKEVPIKAHPFAQIDKGSGLVMMCSAGDITDIQFFREQNLKPKILINKDGTMNEHAGFLQGLKVKQAREKIIEELKKHKLIEKQENTIHSSPISERSNAPLEFIEMPEFYLKQLEFKNKILETANKIEFYPPESKQILERWIDSLAIDWPISRRRFYATPIPLWHASSKEGNFTAVPTPGKYYQSWREQVPLDAEVFQNGKFTGKRVKDKEFRLKNLKWHGDERVLDTWFDSSISELFILKYRDNPEFFKKSYPATLRPQGKEIVRTWLYYTILRGYLETSNPCFKDVWIHNHILDEKGEKMSKSKGNVINPAEIIETETSEAFRFWCAIEGDISKSDLTCSRERIKAEQKTINKLLNVSRFIMQFKKPNKAKLTNLDKLFISYLDELTQKTQESYENYDFYKPTIKLRQFIWEEFASHYIEMVKSRVYNTEKKFNKSESESAIHTLYYILERFLHLVYPIIPQLSSTIAHELKIDLHSSSFPEIKTKDFEKNSLVSEIMNFNSEIWKIKRSQNISLKEPIKNIQVPKSLKQFEKDLKSCHNLI